MQAQFESIFKELGAAASASAEQTSTAPTPPGLGAGGSASTGTAAGGEASFQETIRRTMERMQTSGEQATAAAAAEGSDNFISELLKAMQSSNLESGEGNDEEFSKMLMGMMEQLTNKEILYEPMKELDEKFPEWLEKNRDKTSAEDLKRYEEQQTLVREIVAKFEESTYSDSSTAHREYIVDRMQKVSEPWVLSTIRNLLLTTSRCKPLGRRPQISSGICPRPRMCSICQTSRAIPNSA
jgi:peroxin-19